MAEFATEKRVYVPVTAIPKRVINAFLAAEDKDFFQHGGIDPVRIVKTGLEDLKSHGKRPKGASTITQQVAKNFFLSNEVSLSRKVKEAILAFRIEQAYSKDRILELYLNQIYLGQGTYGVAAAALNYFNKPLDELTVSEAAFLGALPKAPSNFDPARHPDAATERRNWVIQRMAEDGFISQADATRALTEPLVIHHQADTETVDANYFTEEVRRQLEQMYGDDTLYGGGLSVRTSLDPKLQAACVKALRDGLISYDQRHGWRGVLGHINLAPGWQKQFAAFAVPDGAEAWHKAIVLEAGSDAELALDTGDKATLTPAGLSWTHKDKAAALLKDGDVILVESVPDEAKKAAPAKKGKAVAEEAPAAAVTYHWALRQMPAVNGAVMAMDPHTGRVLAMVGGLSSSMNEFNRATQANRQPGSSFKPFVYLAALDKGFTPSTIVDDAPISLPQGPGLPMWQPVNYEHDFLGPQPLRVGVEKSRNAMTVRIASYIGMPIIAEYAKKYGVMDNMPLNLSMAIGAGETTLSRMVTAYSMIDNGGKRILPTLIDRIQDKEGKTLYKHDTRACPGCSDVDWTPGEKVPVITDTPEQVEDPLTSFQMVNIMEGVVQRGTAHRLAALGRPLAGKTGTTNDSKDVWFLGFTPDLVVGVFVGYDQPKSLGAHETGATTAVPIFEEVMKTYLGDTPTPPFRIPPGIRMVRVNPATGQPDFGDPAGIWEAFKPGNEPGDDNFVLNGATLAARLHEEGETMSDTPDSSGSNSGAPDEMQDGSTPSLPPLNSPPASPHAAPATIGTGGLY
jgi:penicillin-binding protein 1A